MNHAVPYSHIFLDAEKSRHTHTLYSAVVAALADINFTIPSQRKLTLDIIASEEEWRHELHVMQHKKSLCVYQLDIYPHLIRRLWTTITLGFVDHVKVESIKEEIISLYTYWERAID